MLTFCPTLSRSPCLFVCVCHSFSEFLHGNPATKFLSCCLSFKVRVANAHGVMSFNFVFSLFCRLSPQRPSIFLSCLVLNAVQCCPLQSWLVMALRTAGEESQRMVFSCGFSSALPPSYIIKSFLSPSQSCQSACFYLWVQQYILYTYNMSYADDIQQLLGRKSHI